MTSLTRSAAEPPPSVASFFAKMDRFTFGDDDEAKHTLPELRGLGESPSPDQRFWFYRKLAAYNPKRVLGIAYRASAVFAGRSDATLMDRLVQLHLREHPPTGWRLPSVSLGLAETLEAGLKELGIEAMPEGLDEVMDFEEVQHRINHLKFDAPTPGALDPTVEVRTYSFDVPRYVKEVSLAAEHARAQVEPVPGQVLRVLYRNPASGARAWFGPDGAELMAIAVAAGEADSSLFEQAGLTAELVGQARRRLEGRGVLTPSAEAPSDEGPDG